MVTDCRATGKPRIRQLPTGIWWCHADGITSLGSSAELAYYGVERAQAIGASDLREKLMRWLVGRSYESGGAYG